MKLLPTIGKKAALLGLFLLTVAEGRLGEEILSWAKQVHPQRRRSTRALTQLVSEEMRELVSKGPFAGISSPRAVQRIYRVVVEGSADAGSETLDDQGHRRVKEVLHAALDQITDEYRELQDHPHSRALASTADKILLGLLIAVLVLLLVTNIAAAVNAGQGFDPWPVIGPDNRYLTGALGSSYDNIWPCSHIPVDSSELFSKFPIISDLVSALTGGAYAGALGLVKLFEVRHNVDHLFSRELAQQATIQPIRHEYLSLTCWNFAVFAMVNQMSQNLIEDSTFLGGFLPDDDGATNCYSDNQQCRFTAECCTEEGSTVLCNSTGVCESKSEANLPFGAPASVEFPFCFMWSKSAEYSFADMLGFAPTSPWPPIPGVSPCSQQVGIQVSA